MAKFRNAHKESSKSIGNAEYPTKFSAAYVRLCLPEVYESFDVDQWINESIEDTNIKAFLKEYLLPSKIKNKNDYALNAINEFKGNPEDAFLYVLNQSYESEYRRQEEDFATPADIVDLCIRILDVKKNETFADFACGSGSSTVPLYYESPCRNYFGIDVSEFYVAIASMRADLLDMEYNIIQGNLFDYDEVFAEYDEKFAAQSSRLTGQNNKFSNNKFLERNNNPVGRNYKFDKIFSNYPWRATPFAPDNAALHNSLELLGYSEISLDYKSADWTYNLKLISSLKKGGKAPRKDDAVLGKDDVAPGKEGSAPGKEVKAPGKGDTALKKGGKALGISTKGSVVNKSDLLARQFFIDHGYVEVIISLPKKAFYSTHLETEIIVFSENNKKVRMVDAASLFKKGRNNIELDEEGINNVLQLLSKDLDGVSRLVPYEEIKEAEYILDPKHYLEKKIVVSNGAKLKDLFSSATRGSNLTKKNLEELHASEATPYRYLLLKNIQNDEIQPDMPYLSRIPVNNKKYCVHEGDVVISKTGPNFKVAVAPDFNGEEILASGNLFILRFEDSEIDPHYIAFYLRTKEGQLQLKRACSGTFISSLTISALGNIQVPLISKEAQDKFFKQYWSYRKEIDHYKEAIDKVELKLQGLMHEAFAG